jgi:hypothetical protein
MQHKLWHSKPKKLGLVRVNVAVATILNSLIINTVDLLY